MLESSSSGDLDVNSEQKRIKLEEQQVQPQGKVRREVLQGCLVAMHLSMAYLKTCQYRPIQLIPTTPLHLEWCMQELSLMAALTSR